VRPVLLVAQSGLLGGAERVLLDWSRALERPTLLACSPGPLAAAARDAGLEPLGLPHRALRARGRPGRAALELAGLGRDVARLARRHRPAVVVASGVRPILAAASAPLSGARLVALNHDVAATTLALALRAASARSAATIATSRAIAHAAAPRAVVIHPGVELADWALPDPPPSPPRALYLGALVPWKRPDLALEIAARVPGLALDLAGAPLRDDPPGFAAALHARAARPDLAGRVRFLGAVTDPRSAMAGAQCLLHCADNEPFGLALVEALAAGRPVVAPAAGGPIEIVTPACGRLYAPGDAASGAAAVRSILADDRAPAAARERAAAFDAPTAARRFSELIEDVARGGH